MVVYPRPLVDGDLVGVTSPSAGVGPRFASRLAAALATVRSAGLDPVVGDLMSDAGIVSGPADDRAAELERMLTDPRISAVVPPWGGEIAIDLLGRLDWDAIAAEPTWLVGFSDISTLLLPLTLRTGVATLHGQNLVDTPYAQPDGVAHWLDVVRTLPGGTVEQRSPRRFRAHGYDDYEKHPDVTELTLDAAGGWTRLDADAPVDVSGRLVGGCLETVSHLAGTPYGDVDAFAREHAPEGLVVYLECAESDAADTTRRLQGLRYAGWFDHANAVLIGRTRGADLPGWTQHDAVRHTLGDLGVPVLADVECGHVPPHLCLVNGALATVRHDERASTITQELR
ncbi:S66 peptidase family protein [Cellulomonas sp. HZM]|uniref:S66 family peptidase n=1 Tax=Cellulomonas sp. HZM TaxID=1454010 RepID=UPI0004936634|nr:S66 peptidase family protein [Cellulomonas sp. HZM]